MGFILWALQNHAVRGSAFAAVLFTLHAGCEAPVRQPTNSIASVETVSFAIASDGQRIAYRSLGDGATTVIFAHCWGCTSGIWDDTAARLGDRYRLVLVDLPGHGSSTKTRSAWTVEAYGNDLAAVANAVAGEPPILVGHSMAGRIVIEAATSSMRGRVRGVVLVDSVTDVTHVAGESERASLLPKLDANFSDALRDVVRGLEPEDRTETIARVTGMIGGMDPHVATAILDANLGYPVLDRLREIRVPLWSINASIAKTNERANLRIVPSWQTVIVPHTGHWLMFDEPAAFVSALDTALRSIVSSTSNDGKSGGDPLRSDRESSTQ